MSQKFQDLILDSEMIVLKSLRIPLIFIGSFSISPTDYMDQCFKEGFASVTRANDVIAQL